LTAALIPGWAEDENGVNGFMGVETPYLVPTRETSCCIVGEIGPE
jgi:hypothetical protein